MTDDHTEYQVRDRLSFLRFLGLDLDQRIPDAKTKWLFRETLAQAQVEESLFAQYEAKLAEQGLQPRGGQLIDASLVAVPKQRNSRDENATIKTWGVRLSGTVNPPNDGRMTRNSIGP